MDDGKPVTLGVDCEWIALDDLMETAWAQNSCRRHDTDVLAKWMPNLDVTSLAPSTPVSRHAPNADQVSAKVAGGATQAIDQQENAASFVAWLRSRPEEIIWVVTHGSPVEYILTELLGTGHKCKKAQNSQVFVIPL